MCPRHVQLKLKKHYWDKEHLNKWREMPCSRIGRLNIVKKKVVSSNSSMYVFIVVMTGMYIFIKSHQSGCILLYVNYMSIKVILKIVVGKARSGRSRFGYICVEGDTFWVGLYAKEGKTVEMEGEIAGGRVWLIRQFSQREGEVGAWQSAGGCVSLAGEEGTLCPTACSGGGWCAFSPLSHVMWVVLCVGGQKVEEVQGSFNPIIVFILWLSISG